MALSVSDVEALLRLKDELSPGLKVAERNVNTFVKNNQASFNALGQAMGLLTGAVGGLVAGIAVLGARGADVADVASAFDQLTSAAGGGEAAIATLRDATDGLISDFDLMTSTNKAFSQGLRLSNDDLRLVGESSRILADQIGGDTKEAYDTLTAAMATGRDRQLQTIGLNIDAAGAVEKLAASLGVEKGALTESQEVMAKKNAILDALRQKLEESGRAELDFGERIQQARVMMGNFIDTLGVAIAQSPVLNAGLKAVGDMMLEAFGTNKADTIKTLIGLIEQFVIGLVKAGGVGVEVARFIGNAWFGLKVIFNSVIQGLAEATGLLLQGLANAATEAAKLPAALGGDVFGAAAGNLQVMADGMVRFGELSKEAADDAFTGMAEMNAGADLAAKALDAVETAMEGAAGGAAVLVKAAAPIVKTLDDVAKSAGLTKKQLAELEKGFDALEDKMAATRKAATDVARALEDDLADKIAELTGLTDAQGQELMQWGFAWDDVTDKTNVSDAALEQLVATFLAAADAGGLTEDAARQLGEALDEMGKRAKAATQDASGIVKSWEQIQQAQEDADRAILASNLGDLADLFDALGVSADNTFSKIVNGFQAGLEAQNIFQAATAAANQGSFWGGAAAGAAYGAQFGPWGAAIGAVGGGLIGLFTGAKKAREEMARLKAEFIDSMGGIDALKKRAEEAGVSLAEMFNADSPKEMAAAIDLVKTKLAAMDNFKDLLQQIAAVKMEFLTKGVQGLASMFKYAGEQADITAEGLDRLGTIGFAMFQALKDQGLSTVEALKLMGPAIDEAILAYEKAGLEASGAFAALIDFRAKVLANEDLVNAVEGWSLAFDALNANGMLTADMFAAMDDQLQVYIADLKEQGFTQGQITAMTLPALYQLWLAQEKYGFALDDATQAIVDQAEASGAFDDMKDPLAALVELQELMLLAVSALIQAFGADLPAAVQKYIDALNDVPTGLPPPPGGPPDPDNPWNLPEKAAGFYTPSLPADYAFMAHRGERVEITPAGQTPARNARDAMGVQLSSSPTFNVYGGSPSDMLEQITKLVVSNDRGNAERLRLALMSSAAVM